MQFPAHQNLWIAQRKTRDTRNYPDQAPSRLYGFAEAPRLLQTRN